jgi:trehalose-6-phosphate synthase
VASQDPDDPGVLVLSRLAGAADELGEALLVNPTIWTAWPMPSPTRPP